MQPNCCAICGEGVPFRVLYPERFSLEDLQFTARKTPDQRHFRIVRCQKCGLIYSNPILPPEQILALYRNSEFIEERQLLNMLADYVHEFRRVLPAGPKGRLLEIGCSSGFFLKEMPALGFSECFGVDPSRSAVAQASPEMAAKIICDEFKPGLFPDNFFDVICFFQVFEHIVDPNALLDNVHRYLRPGGMLFAIHHNIRALMPTLLRSKSSTYDISHIYLWSHKTMAEILSKHGFVNIRIRDIANRYQWDHVLRMLPLPSAIKEGLRSFCRRLKISDWNIKLPVENMSVVAAKAG